MAKKSRTGLQSKISHIFAGVPLPRKKGDLSDKSDIDKKPEDDESIEILEQESLTVESVQSEDIGDHLEAVSESKEGDFTEEITLIEEMLANKSESSELVDEQQAISDTQEQQERYDDEQVKPDESQAHDKEVTISDSESEKLESELAAENLLTPQRTEQQPVTEESIAKINESESNEEQSQSKQEVTKPTVEKPLGISHEQAHDKSDIKELLNKQRTLVVSQRKVKTIKKDSLKVSKKPAKLRGKSLKKQPGTSKSKQKTMVILTVVLSVTLVVILGKQYNLFKFDSSDSTTVQTPATGPTTVNNRVKNVAINWDQVQVYPENKRDPMRIGQDEGTIPGDPTRQFAIKGISYIEGNPLVTIGNKQYGVEDVIDGAEILEITENSVKFERDGEPWTQYVGLVILENEEN